MNQMTPEKRGITVRFEEAEMELLDRLAGRYRVSSATVIRWALGALGDHVEQNGGRIVLPFQLAPDALAKPAKRQASKAAKRGPGAGGKTPKKGKE